jgi:L-aminoadipate-semialdehyde dehydrogenase
MDSNKTSKLSWWKEHLDGLATLQLPSDFQRPRKSNYVEAEEIADPSATVGRDIANISLLTESSPFTTVLAVLGVLLHKWTREEDIVVGSSSSNFNPLILRLNVTGALAFSDLVNQVKKEEEAAHQNEVPFGDLMQELRPPSEETEESGPICQLCFFNAIHVNSGTMDSLGTCDWRVFVEQQPDAKRLVPISMRVKYNSTLFTKQKILDLLRQMQVVIQQVAASPTIKVEDLSLLTEYSREVCPNPMTKLDDTWRGSIQSFFAHHAETRPERLLAVSNHGSYNYGEVHALSNRLANYLLKVGGIQKEERVAIYAHRSCPLVVAMMGILKSGATITIIDPAYPPARQIIYFEVAEPRALVMIKAAGPLPAETKAYVERTKTIRTVLEGLDMEMLQAGKEGVLAEHSTSDPKVEVSPHNICTLSFTSGTTGIPKGVMGRHISLTHFYPWMAQEFGIGENDRFTMLSGIAHDPIQRDVFTPLFFGAQIRIPDQDDIVNPGALSEWCAAHEVTVTHLTPAMGQLLTANAKTKIPSFKNAFFVGDVLVKRDVMRLQAIAPNLTMVNMYGTTETQRSVSYLKIPPGYPLETAKEILPAGQGMQDVQLLVLTPKMQLCGIGEAGEIFVRSYHLAKGYLGLDESSKEKFIQSPFNPNDPFDRMYRTGDVGRYMATGIVECAGRVDDQVKIRGFRVELREIDTYLTQHPKVREAVTLLRRDLGDEPRLVAYFVAVDPQYTVASIRDFLKTKLPGYAIPADFVALERMPLNPNGKIDKNKLPKPDAVCTASAPKEDMTPLQKELHGIWGEELGLQSFSIQDNFFDLGGHSLMAPRIMFKVRQALQLDVPLSALFDNPTIVELSQAISGSGGTAATVNLKEELAGLIASPMAQSIFSKAPKEGTQPGYEAPAVVRGVFLTGATGFLGAFLVAEFMRKCPQAVVYCLTRGASQEAAKSRLKANLINHGLTTEAAAENRYQAVVGNLDAPSLGMSEDQFNEIANKVDIVFHNGAVVHWVFPYSKMKAPNVLSTLECMRLATTGDRLKSFHFVSSTAVLDSDYHANMDIVYESDDLEGAADGLGAGYGQSKWVSEKLIMKAQELGLPATIIRPGYIVGESRSGVTNSDDFLWRLMKGCIELGCSPRLGTRLNMCPVDYVAGASVAIAMNTQSLGSVHHMYNPHAFGFDDFFEQLRVYGWFVESIGYEEWNRKLHKMVAENGESVLMPVLHILDDLPASTKGPQLDAANTVKAIQGTGVACSPIEDVIGIYFSFLIKTGFLPGVPKGTNAQKKIPELKGEVTVLSRTSSSVHQLPSTVKTG